MPEEDDPAEDASEDAEPDEDMPVSLVRPLWALPAPVRLLRSELLLPLRLPLPVTSALPLVLPPWLKSLAPLRLLPLALPLRLPWLTP